MPKKGSLVGVIRPLGLRVRGGTVASGVCTVSDAPEDGFCLRETGSASGGVH